jgi:hypothetical protein
MIGYKVKNIPIECISKMDIALKLFFDGTQMKFPPKMQRLHFRCTSSTLIGIRLETKKESLPW